jgi:catechol 2,3-dioxygenase-like lactoylglutathione lyase family enzyme
MHIGIDPDASPKSKRHICFLVGDLAEAKNEILSRGVTVEDEGRAEGLSRFFVRDPAGNRIEIGQRD